MVMFLSWAFLFFSLSLSQRIRFLFLLFFFRPPPPSEGGCFVFIDKVKRAVYCCNVISVTGAAAILHVLLIFEFYEIYLFCFKKNKKKIT